ncbi:methyltransferase domain-containing protein [Paenibacillus whitsoniae]|uniref:Methyltransferase domain-containing protein n=2 Tax=Paenibacillus whitsoniae TaxID=2496558 RepID=A0A430JJ34_9BACL|nr:methyltransferase domain-containing protein [Paenibacillus whitsoniae]
MSNWLHLKKGDKVLDLCCGMGRHSMALEELGYQVTGVDLSETLLNEARKMDTSSRIQWVRGDMRRIPDIGTYDAVVNLFTSFGYFEDDEENLLVIKEISHHLKPKGKFIIDFLNADYVTNNLVSYSERIDGHVTIREERQIHDFFVTKKITILEPNQQSRTYREQVKLYGLSDFERMISLANLTIDNVYGHYSGHIYTKNESPRMIISGHKLA